MITADDRLFVGIKISTKLQRELDNCAGGPESHFKEDEPESLRIVTFGEERFIGRFLGDGFPVTEIENISRSLRNMVTRITPGHRMEENAIRIYVDSMGRISPLFP